MLFAILGLACAALAAVLILQSASSPPSSTTTVLNYYSFQDAEDSLEDYEDTLDLEEVHFELEASTSLRGAHQQRRLTEVVGGDVVTVSVKLYVVSA